MSLASVLEQIKKVKPFAEENVDTGPAETLNGRRGRKRQSIEQLRELKLQYRDDLRRSAVYILVTGSNRDAFSETATKEFKCFSADPEAFYKDLASRIPPALYRGKESIAGIFDIVGRHLEDKALELGLSQYNQLVFRQGYSQAVHNIEDLTNLIKTAVNEQMGGEIVGINAVHELTDEAIKQEHAKKNTPIILNSGDEKLVLDLSDSLERLTSKVFLVISGKGTKALNAVEGVLKVKDVTNDSVENMLTTIQNSIKK